MQRERPFSILQSELIDAKVEISVSKAVSLLAEQLASFKQDINQQMSAFREDIRTQIGSLRTEMHEQINALRGEMYEQVNSLREEMHAIRLEFGTRMTAVEIALGIRREAQQQIRAKFVDYAFKTAWMIGSGLLSSGIFLIILHFKNIN